MLKEERLAIILEEVNKNGFTKVTDLFELLNVSEMTIRRDLEELDARGSLIKVHGGAKKLDDTKNKALSHYIKKDINQSEKHEVAKKIASVIKNGDVIFLGSGTTIELASDYIDVDRVKIITNALPLFEKLVLDDRFETILIGGSYRPYTGVFVGSITTELLYNMKVDKSFIGVNGIDGNALYCNNEDEGLTQKIALKNGRKRYIISDNSKLNRTDFYRFFDIEEADYLIIDDKISLADRKKYSELIDII